LEGRVPATRSAVEDWHPMEPTAPVAAEMKITSPFSRRRISVRPM
jgi:hypothetical protein